VRGQFISVRSNWTKEKLKGITMKLYDYFLGPKKIGRGRAMPSKLRNFKPLPLALRGSFALPKVSKMGPTFLLDHVGRVIDSFHGL
jgi:hypothetical protein